MLASMSVATAQKKSGAETSLLGIHLYDTGLKVVGVFGTPNTIEAVTIGGTGGAAGGGRPNGKGGGGGPPGPSGGPVGPAGITEPLNSSTTGFGFGDALLGQGPAPAPTGNQGGGGVPPGGAPLGGPGGPGGPGRPGGGGGGGGTDDKVVFTRWVYNRAGCKYGFIFDKFNRVIQIEAIGMANPRVHTARGIGFGSSFAQVIKRYDKNPDGTANAPDGYEISGDTIVVRYLVKNKVAFRLSRLGKDKPQVVTGIAVAAGKL